MPIFDPGAAELTAKPAKVVAATRKYEIHLADGRCFICIDLLGEPPEDVHRQIREHFWRYDIARID